MAELGIDLDLNAVEETEGFSLLEPGRQTVMVVDTEMIANKKGTGSYLKIEMEVTDGPYASRKLWDNLSIIHDNAQTQGIARQQFKQLCLACNVGGVVSDASVLHGWEVEVEVGIEEGTGGYKDKNVIKEYHALQGARAPVKQEAPPQEVGQTSVSFDDDDIPF